MPAYQANVGTRPPREIVASSLDCARIRFAQLEIGELRVFVTDSTGLALPSSLTLASESSQTRSEFNTNYAMRREAASGIHPRIWAAVSAEYGSGLPVEINGDTSRRAAAQRQCAFAIQFLKAT